MSQGWRQQKERGSDLLLRFAGWLSLNLSWRVGRLLLYPICAYFLVFSGVAKRASRDYLTTVLGRPARLRDVYRHYHTFASIILDRVFFLSNRFDDYRVTIHGLEVIEAQAASGQGCLLLGAHIGSFEVLQTLGVMDAELPIKALMFPSNSPQINALRARLNPDLAARTIPLGAPTAMLEVKAHVDGGGMIGLLGDRITHGDRLVPTPFLGRSARLPDGPLRLATLLKVPVLLMFGIYRGPRRYELYFERFADAVAIGRSAAPEEVEAWLGRYAARLEHYCRMAPYNWFNFYDFWDGEDADS